MVRFAALLRSAWFCPGSFLTIFLHLEAMAPSPSHRGVEPFEEAQSVPPAMISMVMLGIGALWHDGACCPNFWETLMGYSAAQAG